ncbi:nucleotide exchange factor GrpE [Tellurirhabdus rosea]|uniref:nucleotide exchange factor GrpE n=1 Tax=Tellurirhabdus rosea TaxID=2674997 RepID=UPI00224CF466|nr:nucleotide exchange factor GrpE [Tellurirhabdus rosea]
MENKETLSTEEQNTTQQPDTTNEETQAGLEEHADNSAEELPADVTEEPVAEDKTAAELAELKDKYLRLLADFENYRRRTSKEKLDLIANANEGMLVALLPVVDDFERAMQSMETATEVDALKAGVQLIFSKLYKTLETKGLKPMVSKGEPFDADLHESVTQFPAPSDDLKGKVIDELEKGYYLNDKVIRFAKVVVGS